MEACPAPQTSAAFHSEFVRTLVNAPVAAVEGWFSVAIAAPEKKTEPGLSPTLRSAQDDTSWVGQYDTAWVKAKIQTSEKRSTLMARDCASSRWQAKAAMRQVTNR